MMRNIFGEKNTRRSSFRSSSGFRHFQKSFSFIGSEDFERLIREIDVHYFRKLLFKVEINIIQEYYPEFNSTLNFFLKMFEWQFFFVISRFSKSYFFFRGQGFSDSVFIDLKKFFQVVIKSKKA